MKSKLQTGDILHCSGHSWISKCIMFFTKSNITHSATFISIWGHDYIFDSQKDGTNLRPLEEWKKEFGYDVIVMRCPQLIDEREFALKALSLSGHTAYNFKLFAIRYPIKIIKSWITGKPVVMNREADEDHTMICSESVAWEHGLENPQDYTPKKLYEYCVKNNWILIEVEKI